MKKTIKGYQQETEFVNAGAGTSTWCIATKGGKKYFIKSFLEVTLVDEETAKNLPAPMVEAKRKSCVQFRIRKERLYNTLNSIQNGVFISPKELLVHNGHFCAVTDYLESFTDSDEIHKFSPRRKTILMRTLILAMRDLSDNHIVHSDIKPDNIVITYNQKIIPQLKIIDFDSGFFEDTPPRTTNEYHGDMVYFAPESMVFLQSEGESDVRLTCAVDKFAVGLLLHKMWCGMLPTYDKEECANVAEALLLEKPFSLHGSIPRALSQVIHGFLQEAPDARMSYDQAYQILGEYLNELPADPEPVSSSEPRPEPKPSKEAKVEVTYIDTKDNVLDKETLTIAAGSVIEYFPKNFKGYKCLSEKRTVGVDTAGHAYPKEISFFYRKKLPVFWLCLLAILGAALIWWFVTSDSANAAMADGNWKEAGIYYSLCPFYDSVYPHKAASIRLHYGIELYHSREYSKAKQEFTKASTYYNDYGPYLDYNRCNKYLTLCTAHIYGAEEYYTPLKQLIGFEDAEALILNNESTFVEFMKGSWTVHKASFQYENFVLQQRGDTWQMSHIPGDPGDGFWHYEKGYLLFRPKGSGLDGYYKFFRIDIIDKNTVNFVNCETSSIFKLQRHWSKRTGEFYDL